MIILTQQQGKTIKLKFIKGCDVHMSDKFKSIQIRQNGKVIECYAESVNTGKAINIHEVGKYITNKNKKENDEIMNYETMLKSELGAYQAASEEVYTYKNKCGNCANCGCHDDETDVNYDETFFDGKEDEEIDD